MRMMLLRHSQGKVRAISHLVYWQTSRRGDFSTFVKGEESEILATIVMQMAKHNNFKHLLYKAVEIHKTAPIQKIINKYEN